VRQWASIQNKTSHKRLAYLITKEDKMYTYSPGTDGTDHTFDIYCNDLYIVSVHYWEHRKRAETLALLLINSLNGYDSEGTKGNIILRGTI
jgi:hypothetical protein